MNTPNALPYLYHRSIVVVAALMLFPSIILAGADELPPRLPEDIENGTWRPEGAHTEIPLNENWDRPKEHPFLFINQADIEEIKKLVDQDEEFARAYDLLEKHVLEAREALADSEDWRGSRSKESIKRVRNVALWYAFHGHEEDAALARSYLLHMAREYEIDRTHPAISESFVHITWIFDLIYNYLNEEDRETIEHELLRPVAEFIMERPRGANNWQSWHNAAIGAIGFVLHDPEIYRAAIWGDEEGFAAHVEEKPYKFVSGPGYGFVDHIGKSMHKDGIWFEQSMAYHTYTMHSLTFLAEAAYRYGFDLYALEYNHKNLSHFYTGHLYAAASSGQKPSFADSQAHGLAGGWFIWNYALALKHYEDPRYAWLWNETGVRENDRRRPHLLCLYDIHQAQFERLDDNFAVGTDHFGAEDAGRNLLGSTLFTDLGMGVLRGPADAQTASELFFIYKPHGKITSHQHADNLAIELVGGDGHRWLPNTGLITGYGHRLNQEWTAHTISKNTVVVDETSQKPQGKSNDRVHSPPEDERGRGRLNAFSVGLRFAYMEAESEEVYEDVELRRRIITTDQYTVDIFTGEADDSSTFDWPLRINGELEDSNLELQAWDQPVDPDEIDSENLVRNSAFEVTNGDVAGWRLHSKAEPDSEHSYTGEHSLKVGGSYNYSHQTVQVEPGASYELTLQARIAGGGSARLQYNNGETARIDYNAGDDWTKIKEKIRMPEEADELTISLANLRADAVWVDQVELRRIPDLPQPLGAQCGYQHIIDVESTTSDRNWQTTWREDEESEQRFRVTTLGVPESRFFLASSPAGAEKRIPMLMARRQGREAAFVSRFENFRGDPATREMELPGSTRNLHGHGSLKVENVDSVDYLGWDDKSGRLNLGGTTSIASAAMVRNKNGKVSDFLLVNGRRLTADDITVISAAGDADLGYRRVSETTRILNYDSANADDTLTFFIAEPGEHLVYALGGKGEIDNQVELEQKEPGSSSFKPRPGTAYAVFLGRKQESELPELIKRFK